MVRGSNPRGPTNPPPGCSRLKSATLRLRPRGYQLEAAEWALREGRAVVCMPTGTGKTLVAALWIAWLLERGLARRVLVLEPTRFLVEQTARFLREAAGLPAAPLHGSLPRAERRRAREARIVVATPEAVLAEGGPEALGGFDALVVDECHHTVGQDPYRVVAEQAEYRYRLGLTAYLPPGRRRIIESTIGKVRCWSWEHPEIRRYVPRYAAEIYESPLNTWERRLYEEIERRWWWARGGERALLTLALRWLASEGGAALRESLERSPRLRRLLGGAAELALDRRVRDAHKLPHLLRALEDHEGFSKAIVFVDRVVIARIARARLEEAGYSTAMLLGRRSGGSPREALEEARRPGTRVVVSTSAGEEGIDLPEADLLVIWSHTSSTLRFIQRLGRLLRPGRGTPKVLVFIVTPDTIDTDALVDSLAGAEKAGVSVPVSPETVRGLIEKSRNRRVLEPLYERPMTSDLLAQALGAPRDRVEAGLRWLARRGYVAYIYTPIGRVFFPQDQPDLARRYHPESLNPDPAARATIVPYCRGKERAVRQAPRERALRRLLGLLEKCGRIEMLRATLFTERGGLVRSENRVYSFATDSPSVVETIVDNIYTPLD